MLSEKSEKPSKVQHGYAIMHSDFILIKSLSLRFTQNAHMQQKYTDVLSSNSKKLAQRVYTKDAKSKTASLCNWK